MTLFLRHSVQQDDGDDRVQHEREEEVFVEGNSLAAQTPGAGGSRRRERRHDKDTLPKYSHFLTLMWSVFLEDMLNIWTKIQFIEIADRVR